MPPKEQLKSGVQKYKENIPFDTLKAVLKLQKYFEVSDKETTLFKPFRDNLEQRDSISGSEAQKMYNTLILPPYTLHGRSTELQKAMLSWFIKKIDKSASEALKEGLRKKYLTVHKQTYFEAKKAKDTLKKHGVDSTLLKEGKKRASGDPLYDSPLGVPMDQSFYEGYGEADGGLPVGPKYQQYIPEYFRNLYKNADALQIMMIRIFAKNIYNPVVEWHREIENDRVKAVLYKTLIKPFQWAFKKLIQQFSAKNVAKMANTAGAALIIYSKAIDKVLKKVRKESGNRNIPSSIREILAKKNLVKKGASDKEFKQSIYSLLQMTNSVLDLAARNSKRVSKARATYKPNCFFQNKLYLLVLMQHKGTKGNRKYMIEFIAQIIGNVNGDKELRKRFNDLKPSLMYLCFSTPLGTRLVKMAGMEKRWKRMKTVSEKKKLLNLVFTYLFPAKGLSKKEKAKHSNVAMITFRRMYNSYMSTQVENRPYSKKRAELQLTINMLLDNLRIHIVRTKKDQTKANKMMDSLVHAIKLFNKTLSKKEKAKIKKKKPYLAMVLFNPQTVRSIIGNIQKVPKQKSRVVLIATDVSKLTRNNDKVVGLKKKIKAYDKKAKVLLVQYKAAVRKRAKSTAAKIKQKIRKLKKRVVLAARELESLDKRNSTLRDISRMLAAETDPAKVKKLLESYKSAVSVGLPKPLKSKLSMTVYSELMKKPPNMQLVKVSRICDHLLKRSIVSKICSGYVPIRGFVFRSMVLSQTLKTKPTKAKLKSIILTSLLSSLAGTAYIERFQTKVYGIVDRSALQAKRYKKLVSQISLYVDRYA